MAQLITTSSRIYIWRHGDALTAQAIDSGNPHLTKRVIIHAPNGNQGDVYVYDQSRAYYYTLDANESLEMWVDDTRLVGLGASGAGNAVEVYCELQEGGSW